MKKLAFAAMLAAGMGVSAVASAADLSHGSLKDEPVYAPAAIWTGFYVGGHIGALWGGSSLDASEKCKNKMPPVLTRVVATDEVSNKQAYGCCHNCKDSSVSKDNEDVNLLGGMHLGYNWQLERRVLGFEADLSFADNIEYLGSLRARLGYTFDNLLIYATGGVAFGGFNGDSVTLASGKKFSIDDDRKIGLVVGAGAEYKLSTNWSIGAEGLYYFFNDNEGQLTQADWCKKSSFAWERDDLFVVRGRLTYHFQDTRDVPLK